MKQKAHDKRIKGEEYISPKTGKTVSARNCVKHRCNSVGCTRLGRQCSSFSEEQRQAINQAFYATGSLQLQREYIVRFVRKEDVKQRTLKKKCITKNHLSLLPPAKGKDICASVQNYVSEYPQHFGKKQCGQL